MDRYLPGGDTNGPDRGLTQPRFSLILLACGRFLSTSARRIDCQVLAEELAPLEVAWSATDPHAVTGPGIETARWGTIKEEGRGQWQER
ncbi:MAG TPA: hypothetical protein VEW48_05255 [Thermoanaerobaculia bacterium]|nr:hypothetical protein [Thermoanaerobaculia bacterium]